MNCWLCDCDPCECSISEDFDQDTNSTVDDRERRKLLGCSYCKPNRNENAGRRAKHGKTKPKRKNIDRKKPLQETKLSPGCPPGCPGCEHEDNL